MMNSEGGGSSQAALINSTVRLLQATATGCFTAISTCTQAPFFHCPQASTSNVWATVNSYHNKQLSCCRDTARCFVSLNISQSHSRSLKIIVGWKSFFGFILGVRKINLSRISPEHIRYTWTGQRVTTFKEFWVRSVHFWQNGGWDESHGV